MRYLVTGASGFIGRVLTTELKRQGGHVNALFRNKADGPWDHYYLHDLGSESIPEETFRDVDVVFHLAGIAHDVTAKSYTDADYYRVNTQASIECAALASRSGVKHFIYFSSVKAVADPGDQCVDERWGVYPSDIYGMSKRKAEEQLLAIHNEGQIAITIVRPSLVYGPGVKGNIAQMLHAILSGYLPPLPDNGNKRSLIHVIDLVNAAYLIALNKKAFGQTYIIAEPQAYSTRKIYNVMCAALGKKIPPWTIPEPVLFVAAYLGDIYQRITGRNSQLNTYVLNKLLGSSCFMSDKIRHELGWDSAHTLENSVAEMVLEDSL